MGLTPFKHLFAASALALGLIGAAQAEPKQTFNVAWTLYAGWMPWKYADDSGIMKKWADKYGIVVNIEQINDYVESINQYSAGQYDAVVATSMDALSIPAVGGVDTTAILMGSYSEGNDGVVSKSAKSLAELKGEQVHLVELSVSHYLLAKALDSAGLSEQDIQVVNTSDADLVAAFSTEDVTTLATWNPMLQEVSSQPGAKLLFDSSQLAGHIKDLTIANTQVLKDNPNFGKAITGAWYEALAVLNSDTEAGANARAAMGEASGTDQQGYEAQLKTTHMFWEPTAAVSFIKSAKAREAFDSVRQFSFAHGLLGDGAESADVVGVMFDQTLLGDADNIKLRFDPSFMQMAADGTL